MVRTIQQDGKGKKEMSVITTTPFKNLCVPWNAIDVGTSIPLNANYNTFGAYEHVENDKIIGVYRNATVSETSAESYVINGNTFSIDATITADSGSASRVCGSSYVAPNTAVFTYTDYSSGGVRILTAGSGTLSAGDEFTFVNSAPASWSDISTLTSSKLAHVCTDLADLYLRRLNVSGTTMSEDYSYSETMSTYNYPRVERVDDTHVLVLVKKNGTWNYQVFTAGASSWSGGTDVNTVYLTNTASTSIVLLREEASYMVYAIYNYTSNSPQTKKTSIVTVNKSTYAISEKSSLTGFGTDYTRPELSSPIIKLTDNRFMIAGQSSIHVVEVGPASNYTQSIVAMLGSLGSSQYCEITKGTKGVFRQHGANAQLLTTC